MFPFFAHLFAMKWWDQCHELSFLNVEFEASYFTVLFPLDHKALYFLFAFCLYIVFQSLNRVLVFADCSTPDFAVLHHHLEFAQTHIHWVGDAIQHLILCHPLLLLPSVFPSIRVFSNESVLHIRWPKYWSFSFNISPMNIQDWFPLGWTGWISLQSKGLSRVFSNTTVQKHQFFSTQLSLWSNSHIHIWLLEKP